MADTKAQNTKTPRFDPATFEDKLRDQWESNKVYLMKEGSDGQKQYILVMFPYPSGAGLHTGHARIYTGTDVLARYYRMKGYKVLHPMGWDAFGLPAENSAIKFKTNPQSLVPQNIKNFKNQFRQLGISYDWSKEINTTDPNYYAITQWLFIEFFKHGLLYKKDIPVYYCPFCKTGLAQEEVMGDGTHERCGNTVEKRNLPQWIFRITEYADSLLKGLDGLDWPKGILEMQKNWIGKKEGVEITYPIDGTNQEITCFTTRPETNFGATFIVLAPEHPVVDKILNGSIKIPVGASEKDIKTYVQQARVKTERERMAEEKKKTGIFTGLYATNRLNGEKLPVWISDFVLVNVGTGAVVGVPAHDKRDYEFAATFDIPVKRVVEGPDGEDSEITSTEEVYEGHGRVINSDFLNTMDTDTAMGAVTKYLEEKKYGEHTTSYHLRDWIFSRQRYWGEPIPMVYCEKCAESKVSFWNAENTIKDSLRFDKGPEEKTFSDMVGDIEDKMYGWFPLQKADLPLTLPDIESYEPTDTGESPLSQVEDWVETTCPVCGASAKRETDTMPNWAGSSWYFLAFPIADQIREGIALDKDNPFEGIANDMMPVNWYVGGAEHAVLHLLYARFWMHVLHDLGSVSVREPFKKLENVGMVLAEGGVKMSKSKGNVVNPDDVISEYGADALRVYEMFMAPFGQEIAWSTQTLQGAYRFIRRIWRIYYESAKMADSSSEGDAQLASELQSIIEKIDADIPDVKFNTPISSMMEFLNAWEKGDKKLERGFAKDYLKLLSPFAPYITDHIWQDVFGEQNSIHESPWPTINNSARIESKVKLPIQVNGKVRDFIVVDADISEEEALQKAFQSKKIQTWIEDLDYQHKYIPGRILNIFGKKK